MRCVSVVLLFLLTAGQPVESAQQSWYEKVIEAHNVTDPIVFKAHHAALTLSYVEAQQNGNLPQEIPPSAINNNARFFSTNRVTLMATATLYYSIVLTFGAREEALMAFSTQNGDADVPFLQDLVPGAAANQDAVAEFSLFMEYNTTTRDIVGLKEIVDDLASTKNEYGHPVNVLCVAKDATAPLMPLCALWAITTFPSTHVTAQSFSGSPFEGTNAKFNWTFTQLVDTYYFWPDLDPDLYGEFAKQSLSKTWEDLADRSHNINVRRELRAFLSQALTIKLITGDGEDVTGVIDEDAESTNSTSSAVPDSVEDIQLPPPEGEGRGKYYNFSLVEESYENVKYECPLVLCKTRLPGLLQAAIYRDFNYSSGMWDGIIPLSYLYPDAIIVEEAAADADGAVMWDDVSETAYFIYRGSESTADWLNDADVIQRDWAPNPQYYHLFDEPEAAEGFQRQFKALSDENDPTNNFKDILLGLTQGRTPKLIICTGQSLGGALSTLCGPWAAYHWPGSSVLVVNEGSPKVGNDQFVAMFRTAVGRAYRLVNNRDIVPTVAPFDWFSHVGHGIWIMDKFYLGNREFVFTEGNIADHSVYNYSIVQDAFSSVTAPSWAINQL